MNRALAITLPLTLLVCLAWLGCAPKEPLEPMPTPRIYASVAEAEAAVPPHLYVSRTRGTGSMSVFGRVRGYDEIVGVIGYERVEFSSIKLGWAVLRRDEGKPDFVMHRAIQRRPDGFVLAGTANMKIDKFANGAPNLLTPDNLVGRVVWIGVVE